MEETTSKVYIKIDGKGRVIACEGGYTLSNINNIEEWIFIDEGYGDKYNLCQTHYFEDGLYTEDMIPRYKYDFGMAYLRTEEEIEADRQDIPKPVPNEEVSWSEMAKAIEEGVNEI